MFRWLSRLVDSSSAKPTRDVLLNDGLELAMDWGENWLGPIQDRLRKLHPSLRREELDELNAECQQAMKFGHESAHAVVLERGKNFNREDFVPLVRTKYPWLNAASAARLFNQSVYYAWKTGGPSSEA